MKTALWVLIVLAAVFGLTLAYSIFIANPGDVRELQDNPDGPLAARVMLLEVGDGRSIPVNYLREGGLVFVGADGPWWRQLVDNPNVSLVIKGDTLSGQARVVLDDQAYVDAVFARLRPTAPQWLPDWLNGKLIEITLQE